MSAEQRERARHMAHMIAFKMQHCAIVARYCRELAGWLGWNEEDQNLAQIMGYVHDAGSLDEILETGEWAHKDDHGARGVQILIAHPHLFDKLPMVESMWRAIRDHNKPTLTNPDNRWLKVLRDADKVAIIAQLVKLGGRGEHIVNELFGEPGAFEALNARIDSWVTDVNYAWTWETVQGMGVWT